MSQADRPQIFDFEVPSCEDFLYIPLSVRFHLDQAGLRISLDDWQTLPYDERVALASYVVPETLNGHQQKIEPVAVSIPFAERLNAILPKFAGHAPERGEVPSVIAGNDSDETPTNVAHHCRLAGLPIPDAASWARLTVFQRYALTKLSRKTTPNHDFLPAMKEFGLAPAD